MLFWIGLAMMMREAPASSEWTEVQPGVWKAQVGKSDRPTLTNAAHANPRSDRLKLMPNGKLPFNLAQVLLIKSKDFASVCVPLGAGEKVFGLGMQMQGSNRKGGVYHMRVDHYSDGQDRLHAPTPLYVSSAGYAVFLNTSRPVNFYVGVGNRLDDPKRPNFRDRNTDPKWDAQPPSEWVEASVEAKGLEVIVLTGPTAMDALRRYNLFCGGGAMPPMWALGFWHRMPSLASSKDVLAEVGEFKKQGFPLDVIGLEPGWQSRSYPGSMEWSKDRFADPKGFLTELQKQGVKVNLWENPYVAPGTEYMKQLGNRVGSHTVWLGAAPDILDPSARNVSQDFHTAHHLELGVSGYKIDEIDGFDNWLWPDHAQFPSGPDGLQMRQVYGLLWQDLILDMYRKRNERTFGQIRGSNGAASRFPFAIYSDTYNHRQYVTALTNCSLAGVLWCAEVRSAGSGEEWVRRMQSACLSPIAQLNAWADGTKPWSFPSVNDGVREAMLLRESLVPYLYTAFAQYWLEGIPPVRPMSLVDGGLETDQYLLGDSLLVAPMFTGETTRKVRLPKGKWYVYQTGEFVGEAQTITVKPSLRDIPLYVREGSAIPTFEGATNVPLVPADWPYTLRCYGSGPFRTLIYDDDESTFNYEKGDYGLHEVTVQRNAAQAHLVSGSRNTPRRTFKVLHIAASR